MARGIREDLVDTVVLEVYRAVRDEGWLADRALSQVLRREKRLFSAERRAVAESVYGLLRRQGEIDFLLGPRATHSQRYAAWLARYGNLSAAAAAKRLGVTPSVLEPLAEAGKRIGHLADPIERLAVLQSVPRFIAALFTAELGEAEARELLEAMNRRAPLTVRANVLQTTRDDLAKQLSREGVGSTPTRFSPWGLVLDERVNAFSMPSFKDGLFEIQDEGSQLVALLCQVRPGKKVVDACAGAGGKTLALAMEMKNRGEIVAIDSDGERLDEARRRARRADVHNVRTRVIAAGAEADAQLADLAGTADVVLVDAPCSGLGTLRRKPDARWRLGEGDPARFAALQAELLSRFAKLVAPKGRLVYATCSIARIEDEVVAEAFAASHPEFTAVPAARLLGEPLAKALDLAGPYLRLWPHRQGTDGFFAAAFERAA
jgi:16S rRNA (cytosine967-C5)-methyltransferase